MKTIPAKTIITKVSDQSYFGNEYNMNLYKGCSHGCIYCDSRSDCYQIEAFDTVRAKENAISIVQNELRKYKKTGVIATGSMSDPYNPCEAVHKLTRQALELIDTYHFGVSIATKSDLITRDIDIIARIKEHSPVLCKITITAARDELSNKIEPYVSASSKRFEAIRKLSDAGVFSGILLTPSLPLITDTPENILGIVQSAYQNGAKFIFPLFGMTLRSGQREYYYHKLTELFPEHDYVNDYIRRYGNTYECHSPREKELIEIFRSECDRLGILYRMADIIHAYRANYSFEQLSFPFSM